MAPIPLQEIELGHWVTTQSFLDAYLEAVESQCGSDELSKSVPPLGLAARVLNLLMEHLSLPPGAVHTSQEICAVRTVTIGEELWCYAKTSRPFQRGNWLFISAGFALRDKEGSPVLKGKTTVMVPAEG